MALLIMCNNLECGDFFEVSDASAGQEVRCPNCDTVQIAPQGTGRKGQKSVEKEKTSPQPPETISLADEQIEIPDTPKVSEPVSILTNPPSEDFSSIVLQDDDKDKKEAAGEKLWIAEELTASENTPPGEGDEELPSLPADESDELETLFTENELTQASSPQEKISVGEGMISTERVSAFVFITGYAVMALGLLTGAGLAWGSVTRVILGIYIGGSVGWLGGFLVAFVIIAGQQKDTDTIQCPACGHVSRDLSTCGNCGLPLTTRNLHPLTAGCLAAGRFALNNKSTALSLIIPAILAYLIWAVPIYLLKLFDGPWNAELYALRVVQIFAVFIVYCNWLGLLLTAVSASRAKKSIIKKAPWFWGLDGITAGFRGLGLLVVYVLPLVTLPLLPLGLLAISSYGKVSLFDLKYHFKFAKGHTQEIALLWLFMLMWCSGLFLCGMIIEGIDHITNYIPNSNANDILVARGFLRVFLSAVAVGTLSLAIFRCLGEFGRCTHYAEQET